MQKSFEQVKDLLFKSGISNYKISQGTGIAQSTLSDYVKGKTNINRMPVENAIKLHNYYLRERIEMNMESLEKAIEDFNEWNKGARIYLDTSDGCFETQVYHSDVQMAENFSSEEYVAVYSKSEIDGAIRIAERRKSYIIDYSRLMLDGWEPMQAQYKLSDEYGNIF